MVSGRCLVLAVWKLCLRFQHGTHTSQIRRFYVYSSIWHSDASALKLLVGLGVRLKGNSPLICPSLAPGIWAVPFQHPFLTRPFRRWPCRLISILVRRSYLLWHQLLVRSWKNRRTQFIVILLHTFIWLWSGHILSFLRFFFLPGLELLAQWLSHNPCPPGSWYHPACSFPPRPGPGGPRGLDKSPLP